MRNRKPLTLSVLFSLILIYTLSLVSTATADNCHASGDVNGDGLTLTQADAVLLDEIVRTRSTFSEGLPEGDMNGDGYIDQLDVILYYDYFENGLIVFEPYGGYPVPNDCNTSMLRGTCCIGDSSMILAGVNCDAAGGWYHGDGLEFICNPLDYSGIGDMNLDGIYNSIEDFVILKDFVLSGEEKVNSNYAIRRSYDINGDGYIDWFDVQYMDCILKGDEEDSCNIIEIISIPCCPSTVRGAACLADSCWMLSPENAAIVGAYYMGDWTLCESNICSSCCNGFTGNVNCSEDEIPDVADITRLIDYLYLSRNPLCCRGEADVNASGDPEPDVSDITRLIDFLYLSHDALPDCP